MVLPGIDTLSVAELERFDLSYLIAALFIHAAMSLTAGLLYGVLLPMLPDIPKPFAWGGLLMPVFWTAATFLVLLTVNRALAHGIDWPSFIFSQFIFGIVAAVVVVRSRRLNRLTAGLLAGVIGGLLMIIPAALWGWLTGHGIWYPANLLAGMVVPGIGERRFRFAAVSCRLDWIRGPDPRHVVDRVWHCLQPSVAEDSPKSQARCRGCAC